MDKKGKKRKMEVQKFDAYINTFYQKCTTKICLIYLKF